MKRLSKGVYEVLKYFGRIAYRWYPTLAVTFSFWWFFVVFTPLEVLDATLKEIGNGNFVYANTTRKTWGANTICYLSGSTVLVESDSQPTIYEKDNAPGVGTGSSSTWKIWPHTGKIPATAKAITVHKVIEYSCLGFRKLVVTPSRTLVR